MLCVLVDKGTGRILQRMQLQDDTELSQWGTEVVEAVACSVEVFEKFRRFYRKNGAFVEQVAKPTAAHEWDPTTETWVGDTEKALLEKRRQLVVEYRRRKELAIAYDTKTLDANEAGREQALFKAFEFAERARLNQPATAAARVWENEDGTFYTFDTDQQFRNWLGGFVITLSDRNAALRKALRQHIIAIRALTTVEELLAYDITQGWPT